MSLPSSRPLVTLTFAQSIDAKIAGTNGAQLILSGPESMLMTHCLRTSHDAILIGIGTALNDDPQLNIRHLPPTHTHRNIPRPVILDSHLRLSPSCKLLSNYNSANGRRPWVICSPSLDPSFSTRLHALQHAGAHVIQIPHQSPPYLHIPTVLSTLRDLGINSLMVEGGARIISSFLADSVVDSLIVTIAPTFVGPDGVGYDLPPGTAGLFPGFRRVSSEVKGKDVVISMIADQ